jgi:hypothetical protein
VLKRGIDPRLIFPETIERRDVVAIVQRGKASPHRRQQCWSPYTPVIQSHAWSGSTRTIC